MRSGWVDWIQKPELRPAVTTPVTSTTLWPLSGDTWAAPWIWSIVAVSLTGGGSEQAGAAVAELSGAGAPAAKSAAFWSVSVQGETRASAVVFDSPGAAAVPSKVVAAP